MSDEVKVDLKYYLDRNTVSFLILSIVTYCFGFMWASGFLTGGLIGYIFMLIVGKELKEEKDDFKVVGAMHP